MGQFDLVQVCHVFSRDGAGDPNDCLHYLRHLALIEGQLLLVAADRKSSMIQSSDGIRLWKDTSIVRRAFEKPDVALEKDGGRCRHLV